jgi:hypothetical protein
MGPGSEAFHGFMENVEVFRVMVDALGLGAPARSSARGADRQTQTKRALTSQ